MRPKEKIPSICIDRILEFGGDNRDRTDDLLNAIQALSQLSYIPIKNSNMIKFDYVAVNTILLCVCYPIKY